MKLKLNINTLNGLKIMAKIDFKEAKIQAIENAIAKVKETELFRLIQNYFQSNCYDNVVIIGHDIFNEMFENYKPWDIAEMCSKCNVNDGHLIFANGTTLYSGKTLLEVFEKVSSKRELAEPIYRKTNLIFECETMEYSVYEVFRQMCIENGISEDVLDYECNYYAVIDKEWETVYNHLKDFKIEED